MVGESRRVRPLGEAGGYFRHPQSEGLLGAASPVALTAREGEMAAMVARGLSNRQIASELFLSERTVVNNISKILHKLGLASSAGIAAWATEQRLLAPNLD